MAVKGEWAVSMPMNAPKLFVASCLSIGTAALVFAIRGDIAGPMSTAFHLTNEQMGVVFSPAFFAFTLAILISGTLIDIVGMRLLARGLGDWLHRRSGACDARPSSSRLISACAAAIAPSTSRRRAHDMASMTATQARYRVVALATTLAMVTYLDRVAIGTLAPGIGAISA